MSWVLIILGGLIGLIALAFIVGSLLPAHYAGSVTVSIPHAPAAVWAELMSVEKHPIGGRMVRAVQRLPDHHGLACWTEDLGQSIVTVRTVEAEPPSRVVREMNDSVVPMTARAEIRLEPAGAGCTVTGEHRITVRHGTWHVPIFRIMLTITGGAKRGVRDYLRRVSRALG